MYKLKFEASTGDMLIAEPFCHDTCFKRSIVLLIEQNNNGTLGFILNKPTSIKLNDAMDYFPKFDATLYFGGPVDTDTLFYIHTVGPLLKGSKEIIPGVYWDGDYDQLQFLINTKQVKPEQFRFFAGYSGWEPKQLNREIKEHLWLTTEAKSEFTFTKKSEDLWRKVLCSMGAQFAIYANFPENPQLN